MIKVGSLFELAEQQLQKERERYKVKDVIDYAIKIRKWLDKHSGRKYGITKAVYGKKAQRKAIYRETGK